MKEVVISGAGLVGSLLACFLAKRGYQVDVFDARPDMRKASISAGRSINLALSQRGWNALEKVNLADRVRSIAIPMAGRMIHHLDGTTSFQKYGHDDQAIYSVSRGELNKLMMTAAESRDRINFHFEQKTKRVDFTSGSIQIDDTTTQGLRHSHNPDFIFGADGAYSAVRWSMQKSGRFNFSQHYLEHGYKELSIPAAADGSHQIDKHALHIWPRRSFMLIALPNLDGSFTCTLFAPFEGENSFESLSTDEAILNFFQGEFCDAVPMMPDLLSDFSENPTSSLVTVRANPWNKENVCLIGDAAHAIVPFYGQGMNCGFEDCAILDGLIDEHNEDWDKILPAFSEKREADAEAIADLALKNFIEMRDWVADPDFLLRKKIEKFLEKRLPELFVSQYQIVSFTNRPYTDALKVGKKHDTLFERLLQIEGIHDNWETEEVLNIAATFLAEA